MVQAIVETVIEFVPRAVGWTFLKVATIGRYRGCGSGSFMVEGAAGLALLAACCFAFCFWTG